VKYANRPILELSNDPEINKLVLEDMNKLGVEANLKGFEKVVRIWLSPELFTVQSKVMTPTMKLARNEA
jgi:long-chain acyl-CoA synthetase